jgi:hypothetical protein
VKCGREKKHGKRDPENHGASWLESVVHKAANCTIEREAKK